MIRTLIALSILLLTSLNALPQSLSLQQTSNGNPLFNGAEITLSSGSAGQEIECHLFLRNNGEFAIDVKVKKIHLNILDNTANHFCWGEACLPPTQFESPGSETIQPGEITDSLFFSGHYFPSGHSGTTKIMYVFFDENNPLDSIGVIVNYMAGETGIPDNILAGISISNPYPNPASDHIGFDYSFPIEVGTASLALYTLTGIKISEQVIYSHKGKQLITTSDLQSGYYFYALVIDGETVKGGKFVIVP